MSDDTPPQDEAGDSVSPAERDATAELERLVGMHDAPIDSAADLVQHPPELDYLEAELSSLRNALRGATGAHEEDRRES
jgi:hypothetical protein